MLLPEYPPNRWHSQQQKKYLLSYHQHFVNAIGKNRSSFNLSLVSRAKIWNQAFNSYYKTGTNILFLNKHFYCSAYERKSYLKKLGPVIFCFPNLKYFNIKSSLKLSVWLLQQFTVTINSKSIGGKVIHKSNSQW